MKQMLVQGHSVRLPDEAWGSGISSTQNQKTLRVPNGVFQTVFFKFLTLACDEDKPCQGDKDSLKTLVFSGILVPSTLVDPDHPLNTPL